MHILIAAPVKYVSSIYEAMLFLSFFLSFLFSRAGVLCGFRKALLFTLFFLVFDWTLHLFFFFLFFFLVKNNTTLPVKVAKVASYGMTTMLNQRTEDAK